MSTTVALSSRSISCRLVLYDLVPDLEMEEEEKASISSGTMCKLKIFLNFSERIAVIAVVYSRALFREPQSVLPTGLQLCRSFRPPFREMMTISSSRPVPSSLCAVLCSRSITISNHKFQDMSNVSFSIRLLRSFREMRARAHRAINNCNNRQLFIAAIAIAKIENRNQALNGYLGDRIRRPSRLFLLYELCRHVYVVVLPPVNVILKLDSGGFEDREKS